jgi:ribosomal protein S18 acetylase RimI-like enzyme
MATSRLSVAAFDGLNKPARWSTIRTVSAMDELARRQLHALSRVDELFDGAGLDYWLFGGWAVDFYAGSVTRAHDDVDIAVWLEDLARISQLLEADGWRHVPSEDDDGGTGYERGPVRLELTYLVSGGNGGIFTPFRHGRASWPRDAFANDVRELIGVRSRVIGLATLAGGKSAPRDDPEDAAKDRADFNTLSRMATFTFRPATDEDASKVASLVDDAYGQYVERIGGPPGPMTEDYAEVIRSRHVTVAESHGTIVGIIVLAITDEGFLIDNVAVHPSHRGTGLGRAFLEFADDEARRAGFDSIYLFTHEKMTENIALYSRIGYVEYDRRLHGEASLVYMRKRLPIEADLTG